MCPKILSIGAILYQSSCSFPLRTIMEIKPFLTTQDLIYGESIFSNKVVLPMTPYEPNTGCLLLFFLVFQAGTHPTLRQCVLCPERIIKAEEVPHTLLLPDDGVAYNVVYEGLQT